MSTSQTLQQLLEREMLKPVTVLFADVVGSTSKAERMSPDDTRALLSDFFAAMSEEIVAEGGIVERFLGDAIMADFGIPVAHEDDPKRAVRAARRMLDRLADWNSKRTADTRIEVRIGINTGEVSTAGSPGQGLMVLGDAVNVAARLEQVAEPGQIVIGERTARTVRAQYELQELEPLLLKGKSAPVRAYVVGAEKEDSIQAPRYMAPLIGREGERELLQTIFRRAVRQARPQLVTIVGEPGIGKTRLVREFVGSVEGNAKVLSGRCLPYGSGITLWPLGEILKGEAGLLISDPAELVLEKLAKLVVSTIDDPVPSPDALAAALAATLGVETSDSALAGLDGRDVYRKLTDAWCLLLQSMALKRPLVVVIEDANWADDTLLGVIDDILDRVEATLMFICPTRPDARTTPTRASLTSHLSLPLEPLSPHESELLVMEMLDAPELPPGSRQKILARAGGNPFFLEEIVGHLLDEGVLIRSEGRLTFTREVGDEDLPETIHAVLLARLDLLPHDEKRALQLASVIGKEFWTGSLDMLALFDDVQKLLRSLDRREFIQQQMLSAVEGQTQYTFRHILIRDVAYETLPRQARGHAHVAIAKWIETMTADRAGEFAELVAHHYEQAYEYLEDDELRQTARTRYLSAAQNAMRRFAVNQSYTLAHRSVALSLERAERVEAYETLGDLSARSYRGLEAWDAYLKAIDASEGDDDDVARICGKAAMIPTRLETTIVRNRTISRSAIEHVIATGLKAAGKETSIHRARLLLSKTFLDNAQFAGTGTTASASTERAMKEVLAFAQELDDPELLSASLDGARASLKQESRYGDVREIDLQRLALIPRLGDTREICDVYSSAAWTAAFIGDYSDAKEYATLCLETARGVDPGEYMGGLVWRVYARFYLGDWDGALADHEELESLGGAELRDLPFAQASFAVVAFCKRLRGENDFTEYIDVVRKVRQRLAETSPGPTFHAAPLARALLNEGDAGEAWEVLDASKGALRSVNLEAMCEVVSALEDWPKARGVLREARAVASSGAFKALDAFSDRLEGRIAIAVGDQETAAECFQHSADKFAPLGAVWETAMSELLLAESLRLMGRLDHSRQAAIQAAQVFRRLGSIAEAERASKLL